MFKPKQSEPKAKKQLDPNEMEKKMLETPPFSILLTAAKKLASDQKNYDKEEINRLKPIISQVRQIMDSPSKNGISDSCSAFYKLTQALYAVGIRLNASEEQLGLTPTSMFSQLAALKSNSKR